ncbi:ribosomal protein L7/L12 [Ornithinimicrobium cavernae]|uniref:ribosomal protein L7/L12 n=1 Tax=Ornithinimicrobium cavernae TaxID=2666047 RepID=UPI000D694D93|nr:ribosomal protein L7/L12 [Ornithinimicrobium cavernae]
MALFGNPEIDRLTARVSELETKLDRLTRQVDALRDRVQQDPSAPGASAQAGPGEPPPPASQHAAEIPSEVRADLERVRALKREGKVIPAIKLVRELTGLGLADAKRVVDQL